MNDLTIIQQISIMVIPLLFAITTHEVAHGWVASRLGDKTALMLGRITFNPIPHIDPIGTILVPALLIYMSQGAFIFGWAKPVPVNNRNLNNPKRDMALVAAAGPLTNLIMAIMWTGILTFSIYMVQYGLSAMVWLVYMSWFGIQINLLLMLLNFLPIPPLDGSRVVESLLPGRLAYYYNQLEQIGFVILLAMLYFGLLHAILMPPLKFFANLLFTLFQIDQQSLYFILTTLNK